MPQCSTQSQSRNRRLHSRRGKYIRLTCFRPLHLIQGSKLIHPSSSIFNVYLPYTTTNIYITRIDTWVESGLSTKADAYGTVLLYLDAPIRSRDEEVAARRQRQHPARVIRLVNSHLQCKTQTGYVPHTIESPFTPGRHANGVTDEPAAKNHTQRSKVARVHIVHTRMVHPPWYVARPHTH